MTYNEFLIEWLDTKPFILCQTSGSTGEPKLIELPKPMMIESALRTIEFFNLTSSSCLYSCISPDFIGGKMMAVRAQILGTSLSYETPSNKPLLKLHSGSTIDLLAVVPSQMDYILDNLEELPKIKNIIIGGARIPDKIRIKIIESGLNAFESYGMTETASHIALRKVASPQIPFYPLNGIDIDLDENQRLCVKFSYADGSSLESISLVTNDIAQITDDGGFHILGRYDNVINSGGKKIHPERIEDILETSLGYPVLIKGLPDPKWGEKIIMFIEDNNTIDDQYIIDKCKDLLPSFCVPKKILHSLIERTENGKKKR